MLLNQMKSPPLIGVPLKFELMEVPVQVSARTGVAPVAPTKPSPAPIPDVVRKVLRVNGFMSHPPKREVHQDLYRAITAGKVRDTRVTAGNR
jgi:hypothetical protein